MAQDTDDILREVTEKEYAYGFVTDIESEKAPKGLNEDIIRFISDKKNEPDWMLEWRLESFRRWLTLEEPTWARVDYPKIDFQDIHYYAAPKNQSGPKSLDEVDPELLKVYEKLGIPLREVEAGRLGFFGNIDPTEGGNSARQNLALSYQFPGSASGLDVCLAAETHH